MEQSKEFSAETFKSLKDFISKAFDDSKKPTDDINIHDEQNTADKDKLASDLAEQIAKSGTDVATEYWIRTIQNMKPAMFDLIDAVTKYKNVGKSGFYDKETIDELDQSIYKAYITFIVGAIISVSTSISDIHTSMMSSHISEEFTKIQTILDNHNKILAVHEGHIQNIIDPITESGK